MQTTLFFLGILFSVVGLVFLIVALNAGELVMLAVAVPILLIGCAVLFFAIRKLMTAKKLRETGTMVMATVTEFSLNTSVTVNGRHPYLLHCVYNGITYQGDFGMHASPELVGRQVPLYLAQDGSGKYLVDVKALR